MIYESQLYSKIKDSLSDELKQLLDTNKSDNAVEGVTEEEIKMAQTEQNTPVSYSTYFPPILEYLNTHGKARAIELKKAINPQGRNLVIYDALRSLVKRKLVVKHNLFYYPANNRGRVDLKKVAAASKDAPKAVKKTKKPKVKEADNRMPLFNERKQTAVTYTPQHRLIDILQKELKYIDDGIDSLRITRSYLLRRLEQVQADADAHKV
jgi:hypothetical protein